MGSGLPELIGADDEILAQQGDTDRVSDRSQVLKAAAEPALFGEHADDARAARLIVDGQPGRIGDRRQRALRGACALHLGDDCNFWPAKRPGHIARRWCPGGHLFQPVKWHRMLALRQVCAHSIEDVVKHAHAVPPPPRVGCLAQNRSDAAFGHSGAPCCTGLC